VVLVGDSIRLGYAPRVAERLSGKAVVISPAENGGDSANVLAHLSYWHGDRAGTGPSGTAETGRAEQDDIDPYFA